MTPSRAQPSRSTDRSIAAFEGRPCADDVCGEALLDTLFDRTQAIDHAADQERVQVKRKRAMNYLSILSPVIFWLAGSDRRTVGPTRGS